MPLGLQFSNDDIPFSIPVCLFLSFFFWLPCELISSNFYTEYYSVIFIFLARYSALATPLLMSEVGKMTIDYLIPQHKPSTHLVGDIVYLKKKCRTERLHLFP
jgi:hypothetical protein